MEDEDIIHDQNELSGFLSRERKKNLSLIKGKYALSHEDAEDIYQDACLALFRNIQNGKVDSLTSRLSTYFTQICVNLTLKKIRDRQPYVLFEDGQYDINKLEEILDLTKETAYTERQIKMLHDILNHLPSPCGKILWNYYGEERSMTDIAFILNYKDADAVKTKKWKCMKKLDKVINDKVKAEFYEED